MRKHLLAAAALVAIASAGPALAESNIQSTTGAGGLTATAKLDFTITIPKVLFLQVGTGTVGAANAAVDLVTFTPSATALINGGSVAAASGGTVVVRVAGNNGTVTLSTAGPGGGNQINNGNVAQTIPWTEIGVTPSQLTVGTTAGWAQPSAGIAHPTLGTNGNSTASVSIGAAGSAFRQEAQWTYAYNNGAMYLPGTYGGVNTNNGRLTYTATLP